MIFKNAMSFNAKIKHVAKEKGVTAQQVQQNYLIEAFLIKLSQSKYKDKFIIKGGYLIGGMIGIDLRTTMDLDATIKGFELTAENLYTITNEIVSVPTEESFSFALKDVEEIRETEDYPGYRMKLLAKFEQIHEIISIDVTTGDIITPREVNFNFKKMFNEDKIELLSYPLETVLAEKIETILSRGIAITRPRDFYDVYILSKLKADQINYHTLKLAIENTKEKRKSTFVTADYELIISELRESNFQYQLWEKYRKQYRYAKETTFDEVIISVKELLDIIEKED